MSELNIIKYPTKRKNLYLSVAMGHFAGSSTHSNYFIDVVTQKTSVDEAKADIGDAHSSFAEEGRYYQHQQSHDVAHKAAVQFLDAGDELGQLSDDRGRHRRARIGSEARPCEKLFHF